MEDAGGPDHITVRVRLPSGTIQTPVSKDDLYTTPPGKNNENFEPRTELSKLSCGDLHLVPFEYI